MTVRVRVSLALQFLSWPNGGMVDAAVSKAVTEMCPGSSPGWATLFNNLIILLFMCLYIRDNQPRIAKRDIVVLKYLRQEKNGYESPCMGTPVALGKLLVAKPDIPDISYISKDFYDRQIFRINGGVIHAMLKEGCGYGGNYCAKAIIPKGTEYWIDSSGTEIAAKQMFITEEIGSNESIDVYPFDEILESVPEKNGIRIGDYQMIDNSFVHPTKEIDKIKARGIVCGFYEDGSPIICALESFITVWDVYHNSEIGKFIPLEKTMKAFNGREITAKYKKMDDKERFEAFKNCINYRKDKKENWYFGSFGEIMTMLDNAIYLNAAHKITGLGFIINIGYWYWSCSEKFYDGAWICCFGGSRVCRNYNRKSNTAITVPFYAFT